MYDNKPEISESDLLNAGYRYGLSLSGSRQDAEDLVHDAWIRLLRRYQEVPGKPLLFKTIRNIYIDQIRKEQRVAKHREDESIELSFDYSDIERDAINADEIQYLLSNLRDVENEALYLSVVEGYTADEIASMTSSSRGSVLSLIHRSKHKLRQWIEKGLENDENPVSNVVNIVTRRTKK